MVANVVHELLPPPLRCTSYVTPDLPHVHERSTELMPARFSWRLMDTEGLGVAVGFAVGFWVALGFGTFTESSFEFCPDTTTR